LQEGQLTKPHTMAVSPVIVQSPRPHFQITASASKMLAVRTSKGNAESLDASNGTGSELAEQLNEREKQKYVKGKPKLFFFSNSGTAS
jgi:hypothetical protein